MNARTGTEQLRIGPRSNRAKIGFLIDFPHSEQLRQGFDEVLHRRFGRRKADMSPRQLLTQTVAN